MGRFHDDTNAAGLQNLRDGKGNLLSQALLNLQSAREHLSQASQLGEAEDTAIRDVSDMHLFKRSALCGEGKGREVEQILRNLPFQ
jgi:hypothetical protein